MEARDPDFDSENGPKPGIDAKQSEAGPTTNEVLGTLREGHEFAHARKDCERNQLQKGLNTENAVLKRKYGTIY